MQKPWLCKQACSVYCPILQLSSSKMAAGPEWMHQASHLYCDAADWGIQDCLRGRHRIRVQKTEAVVMPAAADTLDVPCSVESMPSDMQHQHRLNA